MHYLDYTLIEKSFREKAKDEYKDEINEAGADMKDKEGADGSAVDPELLEARIDCTAAPFFENMLKESDDYIRVKDLPQFPDIFNTSDQIVEEKLGTYQTAMKNLTKEKNKLIRNCEQKMREAEIQAEKDSIE